MNIGTINYAIGIPIIALAILLFIIAYFIQDNDPNSYSKIRLFLIGMGFIIIIVGILMTINIIPIYKINNDNNITPTGSSSSLDIPTLPSSTNNELKEGYECIDNFCKIYDSELTPCTSLVTDPTRSPKSIYIESVFNNTDIYNILKPYYHPSVYTNGIDKQNIITINGNVTTTVPPNIGEAIVIYLSTDYLNSEARNNIFKEMIKIPNIGHYYEYNADQPIQGVIIVFLDDSNDIGYTQLNNQDYNDIGERHKLYKYNALLTDIVNSYPCV